LPTVYGLKNCDTCRTAVKALEASGQRVSFQDVRSEPLSEKDIRRFIEAFGDRLVNTRSTTWRGLSEEERQAPAGQLLADHPALMKRPVIDDGDRLTLGWDKAVQDRHLG
jgi:Spx/MgsR family transcriptional regulator